MARQGGRHGDLLLWHGRWRRHPRWHGCHEVLGLGRQLHAGVCLLHLDPLFGELSPVHLFVRNILIHGRMNWPLIPRPRWSRPHDFYLLQFLY